MSERLRELRLSAGLSQEQLAGSELSASYVSLIESGARVPSDRALRVLAERLQTTVDFLRTGQGQEDPLKAQLELDFAELSLHSGDAAEAERRLRLFLTRPVTQELRIRGQWVLAASLEAQGKLELAITTFEEVAAAAQHGVSSLSWLRCVVALSRCYREAGDLAHAVDVAERALERAERDGLSGSDPEVELLSTLAFAHVERGDLHRAQFLLERALSLVRRGGTRRARGAALWNLSVVALERHDVSLAVDLAEQALALFAEDDDERNLARLRNVLGALMLRLKPPDAAGARALLDHARQALLTAGSRVDVAYCDTELARAHLLLGEPQEAIAAARRALAALEPDSLEAGRALLITAEAWHSIGDSDAAGHAREMAAAALQRAGASRQSAVAWAELAAHHEATGNSAGALAAYRQASAALGVLADTPTVYPLYAQADTGSPNPEPSQPERANRAP